MWLIAINPTSGQGRGATMGTKVAGYCSSKGIDYEIVWNIITVKIVQLHDYLSNI